MRREDRLRVFPNGFSRNPGNGLRRVARQSTDGGAEETLLAVVSEKGIVDRFAWTNESGE